MRTKLKSKSILMCLLSTLPAAHAADWSNWMSVALAPGLEYRWAPEGGLYHSCNLEFHDLVKSQQTKASLTVAYRIKGEQKTMKTSIWIYTKPVAGGRVETCESVEGVTAANLERK